MGVLLSELLVPGWADSPSEGGMGMVGLAGVTGEISLPCHTSDPEIFFSEDQITINAAKMLCADCPMKATCLNGAISRGEPCGVWGGELFDEGKVVLRKRTVGRPRLVRVEDNLENLENLEELAS